MGLLGSTHRSVAQHTSKREAQVWPSVRQGGGGEGGGGGGKGEGEGGGGEGGGGGGKGKGEGGGGDGTNVAWLHRRAVG